MNKPRYEPVYPLSRREMILLIESGDPESVAKALYAAVKYENDWRWAQNLCVKELKSPATSIRWAAATCLGDLAFMRRPLDLDIVLPALENALRDPLIADPASFSLSMVKQFLQGK